MRRQNEIIALCSPPPPHTASHAPLMSGQESMREKRHASLSAPASHGSFIPAQLDGLFFPVKQSELILMPSDDLGMAPFFYLNLIS